MAKTIEHLPPVSLARDKPQGDLTRRGFFRVTLSGTALVAGAAVGACSTLGLPKVSKADAAYRDAPNGKQRCNGCIHFEPPNRCTVVAGDISPHGWSRYYLAKG